MERRKERRKRTFIHAWLDPGGTAAVIPATILNKTEDGALLRFQPPYEIPDQFKIRFGSKEYSATICWRGSILVGVQVKQSLRISHNHQISDSAQIRKLIQDTRAILSSHQDDDQF